MDKRIALVTGASRGIGRAIALELAGRGCFVVINYCGNEAAAEETRRLIEEAGGSCETCKCDVADEKACEKMCIDLISRLGRVDILVNNAGVVRDGLLMRMSEEDFRTVLDTNLMGCFHTSRCIIRNMLKNKYGRIVNISSVSGVAGNPGQANYSASKAAIIGFTKSVAKEYAGKGICVNAVAPGFVKTDMTDALTDEVISASLQQIPMKRMGKPEEIAAAVGFLASEAASYITGQVLCVDGGMS